MLVRAALFVAYVPSPVPVSEQKIYRFSKDRWEVYLVLVARASHFKESNYFPVENKSDLFD